MTPYIHVKPTKTRGWRVVYHAQSGRPHLLRRGLAYHEAIMHGSAAARIHRCPLEVDQP